MRDINALAVELSASDKEKFLQRSLLRLLENDTIRAKLNHEKNEIINKFLRIVAIFNSHDVQGMSSEGEILLADVMAINEVIALSDEINVHLDDQNNLVNLQRKKSVDGQHFLKRLGNLFSGFG